MPTQAEIDRRVAQYLQFMDCSSLVSSITLPVAQKRCFDIGADLYEWATLNRRYGVMEGVSERMKGLGWWGLIRSRYEPLR